MSPLGGDAAGRALFATPLQHQRCMSPLPTKFAPRATLFFAADTAALLAHCRQQLPGYMVPAVVHWSAQALPRNPNGKLDRQRWKAEHDLI